MEGNYLVYFFFLYQKFLGLCLGSGRTEIYYLRVVSDMSRTPYNSDLFQTLTGWKRLISEFVFSDQFTHLIIKKHESTFFYI